jgi:hypothetical protein
MLRLREILVRSYLCCLLAAFALVAVTPRPVVAGNPKVTLSLEEVTCKEAVQALVKATGQDLELREPTILPGVQPPEQYLRLQQRRTFAWRDVRLAYALRELCREYNLRLTRYLGSMTLTPSVGPPEPERPMKGSVIQGIRIAPSYVSVSSQRSVNLEGGADADSNATLNVRLKLHWPDGDPEALVGLENVVARDDQGNLLTGNTLPNRLRRVTGVGGGFPDEWYESVTLSDPHPRARKLQWLEGELHTFGVYRPFTVEVPLTGPEPRIVRMGEVLVQILAADPGTPRDEKTPGDFTLRSKVVLPQGDRIVTASSGFSPQPVLIGASGKTYTSRGGGTSGSGSNGLMEYTVNSRVSGVREPLVKAVFHLVERAEPRKLMSFRITDVPLPPEGAFVPRIQAPIRPPNSPEKVEKPFFQKGGGRLVMRTEFGAQSAAGGTLAVGLAPKEGTGWGPVRWQDVPVDTNGVARLTDLVPGVYRLLRIYRGAQSKRLEGDHQWHNSEVQVTLTAGQDFAAPTLRWAAPPKSK